MISGQAEADPGSAGPAAGLEPFDRRVLVPSAVLFAVLMALSGRYGFHRDELYFLDCARHLQASYVDQPVLAPLLARVSLELFGLSPSGLRLWPALAAAGTVIIAGLSAREFGGGRRAQLLTAAATATMPVLFGSAHIANTTAYNFLAWAALALIVARLGRTGDPRWWLAAGAVAGLGAENNHLAGIFAAALVAGMLLSGGYRPLLNRWFAGGVLIAVALEIPDLWWQATHGWATIAMTHALNHENGGLANGIGFIVSQLLILPLPLCWVWMVGLRFLWRSGRPPWRALVWAYGLLFVLFALTTGGQIYYLGGLYPALLAAGAVSAEAWLGARPGWRRGLLAATAVITAASVVAILPVLPLADTAWTYKASAINGETIGWPQLVGTVRTVWFSLPAQQRAQAVIFTENYSEAGAINELGRSQGLPTAVSGQNTDWWWGPGNPHATTVIAVSPGSDDGYAAYLRQYFTSVRPVATLTNPARIHNIEWHGQVFICTGLREPWGQLWPQLRHYD